MDTQDGGQYEQRQHHSKDHLPEGIKSKLQLPLSCDPPGPANPAKRLVWIVSRKVVSLSFSIRPSQFHYGSILPGGCVMGDSFVY